MSLYNIAKDIMADTLDFLNQLSNYNAQVAGETESDELKDQAKDRLDETLSATLGLPSAQFLLTRDVVQNTLKQVGNKILGGAQDTVREAVQNVARGDFNALRQMNFGLDARSEQLATRPSIGDLNQTFVNEAFAPELADPELVARGVGAAVREPLARAVTDAEPQLPDVFGDAGRVLTGARGSSIFRNPEAGANGQGDVALNREDAQRLADRNRLFEDDDNEPLFADQPDVALARANPGQSTSNQIGDMLRQEQQARTQTQPANPEPPAEPANTSVNSNTSAPAGQPPAEPANPDPANPGLPDPAAAAGQVANDGEQLVGDAGRVVGAIGENLGEDVALDALGPVGAIAGIGLAIASLLGLFTQHHTTPDIPAGPVFAANVD